jgi:hypothetical protein
VLANVPPLKVRHAITNYGVYVNNNGKFYPWLQRGKRFWWEVSHGQKQLIFETQVFPYRVVMLVGHERNEKFIREALSHYLIEQKPAPTKLDKMMARWRKWLKL